MNTHKKYVIATIVSNSGRFAGNFIVCIYLTQTTQVHTDRSTDRQGQTETVKETSEKGDI